MNEELYARSLASLEGKRDSTSDELVQLHYSNLITQLKNEHAHGFSFERLQFVG